MAGGVEKDDQEPVPGWWIVNLCDLFREDSSESGRMFGLVVSVAFPFGRKEVRDAAKPEKRLSRLVYVPIDAGASFFESFERRSDCSAQLLPVRGASFHRENLPRPSTRGLSGTSAPRCGHTLAGEARVCWWRGSPLNARMPLPGSAVKMLSITGTRRHFFRWAKRRSFDVMTTTDHMGAALSGIPFTDLDVIHWAPIAEPESTGPAPAPSFLALLRSLAAAKLVSPDQTLRVLASVAEMPSERWASPFLRSVPEHTRAVIDCAITTEREAC